MRERVAALFRPLRTDPLATGIGAELELIPVRADGSGRATIGDTPDGPGTAHAVGRLAACVGWDPLPLAYGAPAWSLPGGGRLSYEPGGQLEIGSPVYDAPVPLAHWLGDVVGTLRAACGEHGIALFLTGVDPIAAIEEVPLALAAPRYLRMAEHFARIGPAGARMMRQTASLQVSVELGPDPLARWRYLNALTPYLVAAAANSRVYGGADTGHASYRAHLWRTLDPARTGLPWSPGDPIGAYARFAAAAPRIVEGDADAHLTTLFPEVRPRGYFEIRSMDAVELPRAARLLAWIHTLVYDPERAAAAAALIGDPDEDLLQRAGEAGEQDAVIAARLHELERVSGIDVRPTSPRP